MRAVIYQRVSSEEQVQGYSLDAQERAGRLYVEAHGWAFVRVYSDEGRSARHEDIGRRPAFAEMLADAEAGRFDVLVVHKLDRFARNVLVTLETLQRLERAGVGFVSLSETMDFTNPIGKVILATLAAFAQYYSDNLSHETKKGKAERKRQGLYNGLLPFGVTKSAQGVPVLDTRPWACALDTRAVLVPAEGLTLAFELAAAGQSDRAVAMALNEAGYRTSGNRGQNPFTKDTVRAMLRNRFYLGELPDGDGWLPGRHGMLIDPELFARVQQARAGNTRRLHAATFTARTYVLSGLLRCAACGSPMRVHSSEYYRCSRVGQAGDCDQPGARIADLDAQVGEVIRALAFPAHRLDVFVAAVRSASADVAPDATVRRKRLERQLTRLKTLYLEGDVDREEYTARRAAIRGELETLPVSHYEPAGEAQVRTMAAWLSMLGESWDAATAAERREIVRTLFGAVYVANRTAVAYAPRPDLERFLLPVLGVSTAHLRKRRGSLTHLRAVPDGTITVIAASPRGGRYAAPRHRKLTPNDIAVIRLSANRSLRDLAAEFCVSHELIRQIRASP